MRNYPSPRIIIVGSGASGIAAATRLFQNGLSNIIIFEAENRIGGRIHSIKIGEYLIDIGAEWVHGEKDNVAFELATPFGLLQRSTENNEFYLTSKIFGSSGDQIPEKVATQLIRHLNDITESVGGAIHSLKTGSLGEYTVKKFNEYFENHPEISADKQKPLLHLLNLMQMVYDGGENWFELSAEGERDYLECEGDQANNWKQRTYATILDILMKKYPNPDEELPIKFITKLNTKVSKIKYDNTLVKVTTSNQQSYLADHVIFTPSLGVLQKNHNKLFSPPLPEKKLNAIKNLSFGRVAKIIVYYENPWWLDDPVYVRAFYWTEEDKKQIEDDPPKKWMLGVSLGMRVEHRPKLLLFWVTGRYVRHMELTPEVFFQEHVKELITKFFGKAYNLTEPTVIKRSLWATNENFLGTYSYRGVQADIAGAHIEDYAEPIIQNNKPVLQFAGEATAPHYSTVHGAIESGWREADRIINYYN